MALHSAMAMISIYQIYAIIISQAMQTFLISTISKQNLIQIINKLMQHSVELQMAIISA